MNNQNDIFVFGSNQAGRHGKGAALYARENYGAEYGKGEGITGRSYALPTKSGDLKTLDLSIVKDGILRMLDCARDNPEKTFHVTPIGCGLAGFPKKTIAALFLAQTLPRNIVFTKEWME